MSTAFIHVLRLPSVSWAFPVSLKLCVCTGGNLRKCISLGWTGLPTWKIRERCQAWWNGWRRRSSCSWKNSLNEQRFRTLHNFHLTFHIADNRSKTRHVWQRCLELRVAALWKAGQPAAHILIIILELGYLALECGKMFDIVPKSLNGSIPARQPHPA